ncbi:MAG: twin-arginine translocation signal domain-containing protein, partial [Magnetococcales bacterium]|nr:twin-arginine translocation signal domain-containing protein [Magnetococcales bacterium]
MNRRDFLKTVAAGTAGVIGSFGFESDALADALPPLPKLSPKSRVVHDSREDDPETYLHKVRYFNEDHIDDVFLKDEQLHLLQSALNRFNRIQKLVGFGNFYLLDFDQAVYIARTQTEVGSFTVEELNFLEQLFYASAS